VRRSRRSIPGLACLVNFAATALPAAFLAASSAEAGRWPSGRPGGDAFAARRAGAAREEEEATILEQGDLFVSFEGGITPAALPRERPAGIAVRVAGVVRTLSGAVPPALRAIRIELSQAGRLDTRGLPTCAFDRLRATSDRQAIRVCGPALVGEGRYVARTTFPEQGGFPSRGRILAFNAVLGCSPSDLRSRAWGNKTHRRSPNVQINPPTSAGRLWPSRSRTQGGRQGERTAVRDPQAADRGRRDAKCNSRPAILAHVYGADPAPSSRIIVFHIHHTTGTYGIVLTASLPAAVNPYGYLASIALDLHRRFRVAGLQRSYLSAACDAPPGFPGAVFPFARARLSFSGGRSLQATLTRECRVGD
jgi:hypothetical protein